MSTSCGYVRGILSRTATREIYIPQGINASVVAFQLVDDVHVFDPFPVAVDASNIRVFLAPLANLPLQQAIIHSVLHLESRYVGRERVCWP